MSPTQSEPEQKPPVELLSKHLSHVRAKLLCEEARGWLNSLEPPGRDGEGRTQEMHGGQRYAAEHRKIAGELAGPQNL